GGGAEGEGWGGWGGGTGGGGEEPAVTCIHHIEAANERRGSLRRRLEKVAQGRNRAVVKIGPVEPETRERLRHIARNFAERLETPIAALAEIVVGIAGELGPHGRPVDVGANLRERSNAEGARTAGSMTLGAVGREYSLAALDGRRIGPVRRGRWARPAQ